MGEARGAVLGGYVSGQWWQFTAPSQDVENRIAAGHAG